MIIRQSNDRLDLKKRDPEEKGNEQNQMSSELVPKAQNSLEDEQKNFFDDPEMIQAPVFPTYGDENS